MKVTTVVRLGKRQPLSIGFFPQQPPSSLGRPGPGPWVRTALKPSPATPPRPWRQGSSPGTKPGPLAQRRLSSAPGGLARSWPLARACHACPGTQMGPQGLGDSIPPNSGDLPRLQIAEPSQVPRQTEPSPNQEGPRSAGTPTPPSPGLGFGAKDGADRAQLAPP